VFWLSTVHPDGRPHVTPLLAVWHDDAMYFCTGPDERKAKNLRQNPQCILTTGHNGLDGLDVVVEGQAVEVGDAAELEQVANAYESKYGVRFTAPEGTWFGLSDAIRAGKVLLYRVTPTTILGFSKGEQFSQTRWRFERAGFPEDVSQDLKAYVARLKERSAYQRARERKAGATTAR
jgi:nitroimidazol reductase NimA-like FMN-containing flavoprotein (pyridoxamine 5'-phosphate oxidase superfamily)